MSSRKRHREERKVQRLKDFRKEFLIIQFSAVPFCFLSLTSIELNLGGGMEMGVILSRVTLQRSACNREHKIALQSQRSSIFISRNVFLIKHSCRVQAILRPEQRAVHCETGDDLFRVVFNVPLLL